MKDDFKEKTLRAHFADEINAGRLDWVLLEDKGISFYWILIQGKRYAIGQDYEIEDIIEGINLYLSEAYGKGD